MTSKIANHMPKALRVLMACVLALGMLNVYTATAPKAYAADGSVTYVSGDQDTWVNPGGWVQHTRYMEVNGAFAMCCEHLKNTPPQGTPVTNRGAVTDDNMRKILFYGKYGPADTGAYSLVQTACALSNAYGTSENIVAARPIVADLTSRPSPPPTFKATLWSTGLTQSLCTWDYRPYGGLQFSKVSDNLSITADNSCYSLAGAVYGIYADAGCTREVASVTTDAGGYAGIDGLAAGGSFWVKEKTPSAGYLLDPQVYAAPAIQADTRVNVNGGTLRETPGNDPVGVLVAKVDADTGKMVSQGTSSLAGAEFTLDYFDGYHATADAAHASGAPTRQWVYATDDNGVVNFALNPISGDPVYTDPDTHATTLPYGTYVYRETKAPTGYLLPDSPTAFVTRVVYDGSLPNGEAPDYQPYTRIEGDHFPTEGNVGDSTTLQKEQVIRGDVSLTKVAVHAPATGDLPFMDVLAGVDFTVTNDNDGPVKRADGTLAKKGEVVTTIATDDRGYAETTGGTLAYGTYTLHEVESTVPPGYVKIKDFDFTVAENGEQLYYVLKDDTGTALRIVKTDADTGKQIAGYTMFRILDKDFKPVVFTKYYPSVTHMTAFTTDVTGSCVLPEPLNGGGQYYIQEIKAPEGYVISNELIPFTADGTGGWTWDNPLTVTISDHAQKGTITASKTDAETGKPVAVAGIEFDVKAKADIVTNDGTVRAYAGDTVARIVTGADGIATTPELYLGSYEVIETKAPEGYVLNSEPVAAKLVYADQTIAVTTTSVNVGDDAQKGIITVSKADAETGKPVSVAGIGFNVVAKTDITTPDGTVRAHAGDTVASLVTGSDGTAATDPLYLGSYQVVETKAPEGYVLNPTPTDVTLAYAGQDVFVTARSSIVADAPQKGTITVTKIDAETGKSIPSKGAEFDVIAKTDITTPDGTVRAHAGETVTHIATGEDGTVATDPLYLGSYQVAETNAPVGMILDTTPVDVALEYAGQQVAVTQASITYANAPAKGRVTFAKTDAETGHFVRVEGIQAHVVAATDIVTPDGTVRAHAGDTVASLVTGKDGTASTSELYLGSYDLIETQAPEGYIIDPTPHRVVLEYADQVTPVVTAGINVANAPAKGKITVNKIDAETGKPLSVAGAVFSVVAKTDITTPDGTLRAHAGEVVDTITCNGHGMAETGELYLGTYTVSETTPPTGYAINSVSRDVTLSYAGQTVPVVVAGIDVADAPTRITVDKTATDTGKPLAGVKFVWWNKADEHVIAHGAGKASLAVDLDASDAITVSKVEAVQQTSDKVDKAEPVELAPDAAGIYQAGNFEPGTYDISVTYAYNGDPTDAVHTDALATAQIDAEHYQALYTSVGTTGMGDEGGAATSWDTTQVVAYAAPDKLNHEITDEAGQIKLAYLAPGTYGIAEEQALPGYVPDMTPRYMTVAADGTIEGSSTGHVAVVNESIHVAVAKTDAETGEPLAGAELELYAAPALGATDEAGNPAKYGELVDKWTSTDEPHVLANLPAGDYIVHEARAPEKYYVAQDMPITVDGTTSDLQTITFVNDYSRTDFEKTDAETGKALGGAWLAVHDAKGNWIDPRTFMATPAGEKAPELNEIAFTGGTVQGHVAMGSSDAVAWVLHDVYGNVIKSWAGAAPPAGEVLTALADEPAGCTLDKVVTPDDDAAHCWQTADKPVRFEGLAPGDYTLVEISAPEGYELAEDVPFAVAPTGEVASVSMADTRIPVPPAPPMPQTGDVIGGIMIVLGVAIAGSCAMGIAVRKRAKENEVKSTADKEG